jgi:hypothetical protein
VRIERARCFGSEQGALAAVLAVEIDPFSGDSTVTGPWLTSNVSNVEILREPLCGGVKKAIPVQTGPESTQTVILNHDRERCSSIDSPKIEIRLNGFRKKIV